MTKNIFIASIEPFTGKSIIALGLVHMILGQTKKVGYFKPIISEQTIGRKELHIETILDHFQLPIAYEDTYAFTRQQMLDRNNSDSRRELIGTIIDKYKKLEDNYDFTVIEGSDFLGEGTAFEFEANTSIAKNLGAPVLLVLTGEHKTTAQIVTSALNVLNNFTSREVQVIGVIANRVNANQVEDVKELLKMQLDKDILIAVIPYEKSLQSPTMKEISTTLDARIIFGEQLLSNQVDHFVTGAMMLPSFLNFIKDNCLIVTPGDRGDIILGALQANLSTNYPKVAGVVLTAGIEPEPSVVRLIEGLQTVIPIIAVNKGTFETTTAIGAIHSRITADNTRKIALAIDTFEKHVDLQMLENRIITYRQEGITPHMFQYQLVKWARRQKKHIVLP
ncbi:MAG: phosphate acetyltransferase, partial [Chitinophagaceae bacterium]